MSLEVGAHYPCARPVRTARAHGPCVRAVRTGPFIVKPEHVVCSHWPDTRLGRRKSLSCNAFSPSWPCAWIVRTGHSCVRDGRTGDQDDTRASSPCARVSSWTPVRTGRMHGCQKSRLNARPRRTGRASGPCARVVRTDL